MKLVSKNTLLAALLAATSVGAFAADSVDLKVIGTIIPPSCTPTIAGGSIVDFGRISASTLSNTNFTVLPTKSTSLTVTCDAPTKIAVTVVDNRTGSTVPGIANAISANLNDSYAYGVGSVNGKNVGTYVINAPATGATGDGAAVDRIASLDNGQTWYAATSFSGNWRPVGLDLSWAPTGGSTPGAYTIISQPLNVSLGLNKISGMPALNQEVPIDGLATFSLVYL
ncbi:DUF1120 domain-containing protein [Paraburkholderia gardini]|uniref:DUF1120 domain-containing protein n=1 Tax=Paraburkholderia gardini TaxID=2823469 RepID=UPI001DB3EFCF|nr:DUF1120 domain-containing protein [Paraburkholderia gardini]CAG4918904.1 Protein GltF [Paraburkholderia gardini]